MKKFFDYLNNINILIFIGLLITTIILWNRLLRIRLPRVLPFILTNLNLLTLLCICISLGFVLIVLVFNYFKTSQKIPNNIILVFNDYIYRSLYHFNEKIKEIISTNFNVDLIDIYLIILNFLRKYILKSKFIFFIFNAPKILLPLLLLNDIFYFNEIKYFYSFSILLLMPLIYRYLFYNLYRFYIHEIENIDNVLEFNVNFIVNNKKHTQLLTNMPCHFYIQEHTLDLLNIRKNENDFSVNLKPEFIENELKNKSEQFVDKFYDLYCKNTLPFCCKIYEVLYVYTIHKKNSDFFINLFMLLIYFISWTYILLTADYSNITPAFLCFIFRLYCNEEPFSGIIV